MINNNILDFLTNLNPDKDIRGNSKTWANWMSQLALNTCVDCADNRGKIFDISILNGLDGRPVGKHLFGQCIYVPMRTKKIGTATNQGENGADFYLYYYNRLPDYYINKKEARKAGWDSSIGNFDIVLPGKMIGGDIFQNRENKLPVVSGRIWYEADIDYFTGYRNRNRILYSNDGLIFVTYDHCMTFYEII